MLHHNMYLSRLIVDAQQLQESRLRKRNRETKKVRSFESGFSKSRLYILDKPKFKKGFSNQVPSNSSKTHNDRVSNPMSQRQRPTCGKCGKKHMGEFIVGTNSCYCGGKSGYMVSDCPNMKSQGKGNIQVQLRDPSSESPKRNRFYALKARGKQESSPDVATGMLQVFCINVYSLLDPGSTLSFVTPLVATKFYIFPDVLIEHFSVCTPMGDFVVAKSGPVMLLNRVIHVDFVELDMFDFYIILCMDWLQDVH